MTNPIGKYKFFFSVVLTLIGLSFFQSCSWDKALNGTKDVNIPDSNLRAAIRSRLGKPIGESISAEEMATLWDINVPNAHIRNLIGLEFATNLKGLSLWGNLLTDLTPISGLTSLLSLELGNNSPLTNLEPISGLTNLEKLVLTRNAINALTDISPLSILTSLRNLDLSNNLFTDISPLSSLTGLTVLHLYNNTLTDISVLSGLSRLRVLSLENNNISDISPLVTNTGLVNGGSVFLSENPLSDTSLNTHIPALQSKGVTVFLGSSYFGPSKSPVDIAGDKKE